MRRLLLRKSNTAIETDLYTQFQVEITVEYLHRLACIHSI